MKLIGLLVHHGGSGVVSRRLRPPQQSLPLMSMCLYNPLLLSVGWTWLQVCNQQSTAMESIPHKTWWCFKIKLQNVMTSISNSIVSLACIIWGHELLSLLSKELRRTPSQQPMRNWGPQSNSPQRTESWCGPHGLGDGPFPTEPGDGCAAVGPSATACEKPCHKSPGYAVPRFLIYTNCRTTNTCCFELLDVVTICHAARDKQCTQISGRSRLNISVTKRNRKR